MTSNDDASAVAFVTGANQGLGLSLVRALCRQLGGPILNDDARFIVVASAFGRLPYLSEELRPRFDPATMTLEDLEKVLDQYATVVEAGQDQAAGWPASINVASKIGQVAAVRIMARDYADEARRRGILINAACPGLRRHRGVPAVVRRHVGRPVTRRRRGGRGLAGHAPGRSRRAVRRAGAAPRRARLRRALPLPARAMVRSTQWFWVFE
jgi:NAD(P)-dependent dehydrogenase (short-subunit alcohol dehydrogenase family)